MERMNPKRGGWWVVGQGVLLTLLVVVLVTGTGTVGRPTGPSGLARMVGMTLIVGAIVEGLLGAKGLGANLTPYPEPLQQAQLVETGIYGLVRHPLYGSVIAGSIGVSLLAENAAALGLSLVIVAFFFAKSRFEEVRLVAHFPGYGEYRSGVTKRFIPWIL